MSTPAETRSRTTVTPWRKSTFSTNGDCVEVATTGDGGRLVRDTKDRSGPVLHFTRSEWHAFLLGVRAGEFDEP